MPRRGPGEIIAMSRVDRDFLDFPNTMSIKNGKTKRKFPRIVRRDEVRNY
jgi:hypothetical protein